MAFFSLLASCDIEKNAEHHPVDDVSVGALPSCRNPSHIVTNYDPEIDLVEPATERVARNAVRTRSRSAGVDVRREFLEGDFVSPKADPITRRPARPS